jgi:NAD(P)-dependent dehydrogenase (short-subunit alcohol dehydrogenase family)
MTRLDGKTALITGTTDGVGRVVAKRLGEAGARVLVHGRNRERGERFVAEIKEAGGTAEFPGGGSLRPSRGAPPC